MPSLRLKGDYLAIVTLGFGQIIVVLLNNIEAIGGARGYSGIPIVKSFFWIFLIAVLTIVVVHNLVHSAIGRALISIREDELASEAMGVNTTRYKVMAFVISSALAGAGGVLLAHFDGYLNPKSFEFIKSFEILIMIILGGWAPSSAPCSGHRAAGCEALREFAQYRMVIYRCCSSCDDHGAQRPARRTRPGQGWRATQPTPRRAPRPRRSRPRTRATRTP